jgi:transcriptional regulator with XRE-family HTH domain
MKDRLLQIINRLGYSATRLADEIDVQRSGISHILSGRNQPSFDFLVKLLNKFPEIDAQWLLLGKGDMMKSSAEDKISLHQPASSLTKLKQQNLFEPSNEKPDKNLNPDPSMNKVTNVNNVQRIVLLNMDGTFEIFNQVKKD